MSRRPVSLTGVAQPLRSLRHRFAFTFLVLAAFALLLLGKADVVLVQQLRVTVTDAVAPVLDVLSRPAQSVSQAIERVRDFRDLHARLELLEEENRRLREWRDTALRVEAENRSLRRLTRFVPPPRPSMISARVIADSGGPFVRSIVVNVGSREGARRGLAVVSGEGLVGSVVEVGDRHARVLLVTDLNSQIPVFVEGTRDPAVAAGDNTKRLRLHYLPQNARISPGDRLVTSGHGGMFPSGIPVGVVTAISEAGVFVKPVVDWTRLEFVRLLDYGLAGAVRSSTDDTPPFAVDPTADEPAGAPAAAAPSKSSNAASSGGTATRRAEATE